MPHFGDGPYDASELAIFQQAYEDACRKLGLNPKTSDFVDDYSTVRNRLAAAIMDAARRGERDPRDLTAFAIAFGMRNWHLPKEIALSP